MTASLRLITFLGLIYSVWILSWRHSLSRLMNIYLGKQWRINSTHSHTTHIHLSPPFYGHLEFSLLWDFYKTFLGVRGEGLKEFQQQSLSFLLLIFEIFNSIRQKAEKKKKEPSLIFITAERIISVYLKYFYFFYLFLLKIFLIQ